MEVAYRGEANPFKDLVLDPTIVSSSYDEVSSKTSLDNELAPIEFVLDPSETHWTSLAGKLQRIMHIRSAASVLGSTS